MTISLSKPEFLVRELNTARLMQRVVQCVVRGAAELRHVELAHSSHAVRRARAARVPELPRDTRVEQTHDLLQDRLVEVGALRPRTRQSSYSPERAELV